MIGTQNIYQNLFQFSSQPITIGNQNMSLRICSTWLESKLLDVAEILVWEHVY